MEHKRNKFLSGNRRCCAVCGKNLMEGNLGAQHIKVLSRKNAKKQENIVLICHSCLQDINVIEKNRLAGAGIGGAVLGASLGGPAGAIIGGVIGLFMGDAANKSKQGDIDG